MINFFSRENCDSFSLVIDTSLIPVHLLVVLHVGAGERLLRRLLEEALDVPDGRADLLRPGDGRVRRLAAAHLGGNSTEWLILTQKWLGKYRGLLYSPQKIFKKDPGREAV